jgi:ATP-dependent DNA helicase RecQ
MVLPKPVVLISPLLALLKDQQQKLVDRDIPCVRLDGTVRGKRRATALERIAEGGSLLVMTTPETLAGVEAREALGKSGVSLLAVDEAHCLSEWGHDFRPAYLRLGAQLPALGHPPVLALTATATDRVRESIVGSLRMQDPTVVASSPHRSNLAFEVLPCEGDLRLRALVRLVRRLRRPGIIYCATRREVDLVYALLRRFKIRSHRYHGGMTATERNQEQERFMKPRSQTVMVATSAFGLGIDKPDIRYVLHFQSPDSLEAYVQEAGRGGRDGKKANAILMFDPADRAIHEALLARSRVRPDQLYRLGAALAAWSDEDKTPTLEALALSSELGERTTAALLAKIEDAGLVERVDHEVRILARPTAIESGARALAGQFETLRTQDGRRLDALEAYAKAQECRAVFLRRYFGETGDEPCELCDVCLGRPARPEGFFDPLAAPKKKATRKRGRRSGRSDRTGRGGSRRRAGDATPAGEDGETPRRRRRGGRSRRRSGGAAAAGEDAEKKPGRGRSRRRSGGATAAGEDAEKKPGRGRRRGRRGGRRRRRRPGSDGD